MYLVFSEFTSSPISLLASNRASAFFFMIFHPVVYGMIILKFISDKISCETCELETRSSKSCVVAGFDVSGVEPSGSATGELS
jgi:hypothetical protein